MKDQERLTKKDIEQIVLGYHKGTPGQHKQTVQQLHEGGGIDHFVGKGVEELLKFLFHIFG
jgi:hypothetical protein